MQPFNSTEIWFHEDGIPSAACICIPFRQFDVHTLSFCIESSFYQCRGCQVSFIHRRIAFFLGWGGVGGMSMAHDQNQNQNQEEETFQSLEH